MALVPRKWLDSLKEARAERQEEERQAEFLAGAAMLGGTLLTSAPAPAILDKIASDPKCKVLSQTHDTVLLTPLVSADDSKTVRFSVSDDGQQRTIRIEISNLGEELAAAEGGTVSQFTHSSRGLEDYIRFCEENTGVIMRISSVKTHSVTPYITCRAENVEYDLSTSTDNDTLSELCNRVGGQVVGVAVMEGSDFNVPACHIKPFTDRPLG